MNLDFWHGHFLGFITAIGCMWLLELGGKRKRSADVTLVAIYAVVVLVLTFMRAPR